MTFFGSNWLIIIPMSPSATRLIAC